MKKKWREQDVYAKLMKRFPDPAFVLLSQVRNSTGFIRRERTADAIAVSVWPSRGLYLVGIEIKTGVADWKQELANPAKAAEIQKYCLHWYVAAPKGLIDVATVPPTWGLLECDGRGTSTTKAAPELKPIPVDTPLLCSILRNVARSTIPKAQVEKVTEDQIEARVESRVHAIEYDLNRLRETIKKFEEASGVKLASSWEAGRIGKAVKVVMESGIDSYQSRLQYIYKQAKGIATSIGNELEKAEEAYNAQDRKPTSSG